MATGETIERQPLKAEVPIVFVEVGIVIARREVQPLKELLPIALTEVEMAIDFRDVH